MLAAENVVSKTLVTGGAMWTMRMTALTARKTALCPCLAGLTRLAQKVRDHNILHEKLLFTNFRSM